MNAEIEELLEEIKEGLRALGWITPDNADEDIISLSLKIYRNIVRGWVEDYIDDLKAKRGAK